VYSVCSIAPEEGDGVVDDFLARHGDFAVDRGGAAGELKDVIDARGFMKTRPDLGGLDGFFAARLVRR
jgi:16S rRNA (cytosine967-C5)-methyltransferase